MPPKRKQQIASDEDEQEDYYQSEASGVSENLKNKSKKTTKPAQKSKTTKTKARPAKKSKKVEKDDSEEDQASEGKTTAETSATGSGKGAAIMVLNDEDGEKYIDLGKKKRATVRSFKGTKYVDLREFYDAGGQEKPGKKGISLTVEQWQVLKRSQQIIDDLFANLKK